MTSYIAIFITVVIGLAGLFTTKAIKTKIILGCMIVLSGAINMYINYVKDITAEQQRDTVNAILTSQNPNKDQIDSFLSLFHKNLGNIACTNWYHVSANGGTSIDMRSEDKTRIGYLFISHNDLLRTLVSHNPELTIKHYLTAPNAHQSLSSEWNRLTKEMTILMSILASQFGEKGVSYDLDSDNHTMTFRLGTGSSPSIPIVTLFEEDLKKVVNMSRIDSGAYVVHKCEKKWGVKFPIRN